MASVHLEEYLTPWAPQTTDSWPKKAHSFLVEQWGSNQRTTKRAIARAAASAIKVPKIFCWRHEVVALSAQLLLMVLDRPRPPSIFWRVSAWDLASDKQARWCWIQPGATRWKGQASFSPGQGREWEQQARKQSVVWHQKWMQPAIGCCVWMRMRRQQGKWPPSHTTSFGAFCLLLKECSGGGKWKGDSCTEILKMKGPGLHSFFHSFGSGLHALIDRIKRLNIQFSFPTCYYYLYIYIGT